MLEKIMPTVQQSSRALYDAGMTLNQLKINFILDGGTLLGFYRDGTFAADDHDDIDLTVHADKWKRRDEIVKALTGAGFEVYLERPRNESEHYSAQLSFTRENVKIDIMFKEIKEETRKAWWTVYGRGGVFYKAVPAELLYKCDYFEITLDLGDGKVIGKVGKPRLIEEYLTYRYGDWKTPVHRSNYSCYTTDKCLVEPNSYDAV